MAELDDMKHELLILKVRAERVRRVHLRVPMVFGGGHYCSTCLQVWPCPTIRIHNGLDGDDWGDGPDGET